MSFRWNSINRGLLENMLFAKMRAEKARKAFIRGASGNDRVRLATEVLPSNCDAECDIVYETPDIPEHRLDIYKLKGTEVADEIFFLVHGGAFVYGSKEIDKNFGMNLAVFSQIPVANVNYHLLPEKSLQGILADLCSAMDFLTKQRGIRKVHLIGDSAGAYLAMMLACALLDKDVRHDMGIFIKSDVEVLSVASICGVYTGDRDRFPGYFFTKPTGARDGDNVLPEYVFDLKNIISRTGLPKTCLITGDKDFLHDMNVDMRDFLAGQGIPVKFYDAISTEGEDARHVFAISHPSWQESHAALKLIIENVVS